MSDARNEILRRIRFALPDVPRDEEAEDIPVARDYRQSEALSHFALVEQFVERVAEYKAVVHRVTADSLPAAIAAAFERRGVKRLVVPGDLPAEWLPAAVDPLRDPGLTYDQLDASQGVLTACALGIAQTGTIVLDGGPHQGRRALSLVPDYHLCVIREDQIVALVPEAVAQLAAVAADPGRPLTWISGPSATSDIELNRVEGVHGPRTLEVLVVSEKP
jgi:L-lactate dehydrogenase complex protein LldG